MTKSSEVFFMVYHLLKSLGTENVDVKKIPFSYWGGGEVSDLDPDPHTMKKLQNFWP
jgi:hypothetical protein